MCAKLYSKPYVNGTVDFIFDLKAKAWFESCDIKSIGAGSITTNGNRNSSSLSEYVINNARWNKDNNTANVYFMEFNNRGPGSASDQRVSFSSQLTAAVPITDILGANYKSEWFVDSKFV
ncbi:unnamed protein product [Phytophthora fragariaefolia]|uniref:Unnamed protein product n=1 Tax=Phytophthora fragariaefolia TaxID=1490495 RepID=A0A9W6Y9J7_9STRA|nr:unnamed protein product [Phytophthora fragariaefolia]